MGQWLCPVSWNPPWEFDFETAQNQGNPVAHFLPIHIDTAFFSLHSLFCLCFSTARWVDRPKSCLAHWENTCSSQPLTGQAPHVWKHTSVLQYLEWISTEISVPGHNSPLIIHDYSLEVLLLCASEGKKILNKSWASVELWDQCHPPLCQQLTAYAKLKYEPVCIVTMGSILFSSVYTWFWQKSSLLWPLLTCAWVCDRWL